MSVRVENGQEQKIKVLGDDLKVTYSVQGWQQVEERQLSRYRITRSIYTGPPRT